MTITPLRLLVTGSQNFTKEHFVHTKLDQAVLRARGRRIILVQGACPKGPDNFAHRWYERRRVFNRNLSEEQVPADWHRFGLSAGFRRNEEMVRRGAWGVLGFVAPCIKPGCRREGIHGSHGTMHCLKVAKHYNLNIRAWKENW